MKQKKHRQLFLILLMVVTGNFLIPEADVDTNFLEVDYYNLSGQLQEIYNKELVIGFSHDMVPLAGKRKGKEIVLIKPFVKGEFLWRGTKTLVFKPKTRFAYSTTYRVTVKKGTKSLEGKILKQDINWEFTTPLPEPYKYGFSSMPRLKLFTDGAVQEEVGLKDTLYIKFQQPVSAKEVRRRLRLTALNSAKTFKVKSSQHSKAIVKITFITPLKPGTTYRLVLSAGLKGLGGNRGIDKDFTLTFQTYKHFRYRGKKENKIPQDESQILELLFSNPLKFVRREQIAIFKTVNGREASQPLSVFTFQIKGKALVIQLPGPLAVGDRLTLCLKKDILNIYGDNLDGDLEIAYLVCSPLPAAYVDRGETGLDLFLRNIKQMTVTLFKFKDTLMELAEKETLETVIKKNINNDAYLECKEVKTIDFNVEGTKHYPVPYKEKGFGNGLFGMKIEGLELYNSCGDEEISNFANSLPSELAIFHKRELDFVLRAGESSSLFWIYNKETARPVPHAGISISRKNKKIKTGSADAQGVWLTGLKLEPGDFIMVEDPQTSHKIFYKLKERDLHYQTGEDKRNAVIELFTDRHLYRPGSTIYIGGIIKELRNGKYQNPKIKKATIIIKDPDHQEIKEDSLQLDELGGFSYSFPTNKETKKGDYIFTVGYKDESYDHWFTVDYYQADTIKLEVTGAKEVYGKNDRFDALTTGYYLSGNPMSGEALKFTFQLEEGISHYWFREVVRNLDEYTFSLDETFMNTLGTPGTVEVSCTFDSQGKYRAQIDLGQFKKINSVSGLMYEITGETAEGKEFSTSGTAAFFPGNRAIGIKLPPYNFAAKPIKMDLAVIDNTTRLSETKAKITIFKQEKKDGRYIDKFKKIKEFKELWFKGKDPFEFTVETPGEYIIKCDAIDSEGDIVSSCDSFYVRGIGLEPGAYLEVETGKQEWHVGEIIPISIESPAIHEGKALVTVEKDKILDFFVIDLKPGTSTLFELMAKEEYFPCVVVNVAAIFKDEGYESEELRLDIIGYEKSLDVVICPEARELEPAAASRLQIKVTDWQGNGRKARAFVYAVNEGNLQLSYYYRVPGMFMSFYFFNSHQFMKEMDTLASEDIHEFQPLQSILFKNIGTGIVGRVTNPRGNPLAGVQVTLRQGHYWEDKEVITQTVTNEKGFYLLARLSPGACTVTFKKRGYRTFERYLMINKSEGIEKFDIRLREGEESSREELNETAQAPGQVLDLEGEHLVFGTVVLADGSPVPGVLVTLSPRTHDPRKRQTIVTNERGYYFFDNIPNGKYEMKVELEGFKTMIRRFEIKNAPINMDVIMEATELKEEVTVSASTGIPDGVEDEQLKNFAAPSLGAGEFQSLLRQDFQEVLFFKVIETDEKGIGELEFKTSDMLTTYRVMAVAYSEDCFGSAETNILVSKNLYMEEAMPEFARKHDRFTAGVQVSNRTDNNLQVTVNARPENISIRGEKDKIIPVPSRGNRLVPFQFEALQAGESEIKFHALAETAKDGLLKKLPVYDCLVTETLLDFDVGKHLKKQISPAGKVLDPKLKLKLTPSILKPAGKIAEKLVFYPYECMEQRTSKVMPYLILNDALLAQLELKIDQQQVRQSIRDYVKIMPEFMDESGGLSYYRGGKYISDYLTVYVLWALRLAKQQGIAIDAEVVSQLEQYLKKRKLPTVSDCFYQMVLSMDNQAEASKLNTYFAQRQRLPVTARVFLYRAINNQLKDRKKLKQMLREFNNGLQVGADFAYFDVKEFEYDREYPFYSSRYVTALLLQAILEVEGEYKFAPRIIKWLLEVPPYHWDTTQTNFWILYAMDEYARQKDQRGIVKAEVKVMDQRMEKKFHSSRDVLKLEKNLENQAKTIDVEVSANQEVFLTTEYTYKLEKAPGKSRGIKVKRNVYDETGKPVKTFVKGKIYQVELLLEFDKEVPYGVVDEPLAAGFEVLRQDLSTTRKLKEFNTRNQKSYYTPWWYKREHSAERIVYYSYAYEGKLRLVYFVKALYPGTFTWMPTKVQGMYHPQYFGRAAVRQVTIAEKQTVLWHGGGLIKSFVGSRGSFSKAPLVAEGAVLMKSLKST